MKLAITNHVKKQEYRPGVVQIRHLLQVAKTTLATEHQKRQAEDIPKNMEISLVFTDDEGIRTLNREFRQKDTATDVLSFPLYQAEEPLLPHTSLGDIVISVERMAEQAKAYGPSQDRELSFLFVHGLLHLLGYDHELSPAEESLQFHRQDEVLALLHIIR